MKKLLAVALGIALGAGGLALAQTYSVFSYLRVLNIADVRTSIQNQDAAESVVVDDNFSVTGTSNFTGAITVPSCTGCGGGSPGGSNTQVQFNDSSAFGGDAGLTYNKTTDALTVGSSLTVNSIDISPAQDSSTSFTSASFSGGCTASSGSGFLRSRKMGNWVQLYIELSCTANAASFTPGNIIPAGIRPSTTTIFGLPIIATGTSAASNASFGTAAITTAGALVLTLQDGSTWDAAGSKGLWTSVTYPIQ